jgi:hypothetical protein
MIPRSGRIMNVRINERVRLVRVPLHGHSSIHDLATYRTMEDLYPMVKLRLRRCA